MPDRAVAQAHQPPGRAVSVPPRLDTWLRNRHARKASSVAAAVIAAVHTQHRVVPGEQLAAGFVARLARKR